MKPSASLSPTGLVRGLGPLMATAVVIGTVIGSGVFKKPQSVAQNVEQFGLVAVVWITGGLLALLGAFALGEIAVLYPKAGGNYVFLREGYGMLAGFLFGWVEFWVIRAAALAALATIFSESLHDVLRNPAFQDAFSLNLGDNPLDEWRHALTIGVILALAVVNILGVRWGGFLQVFITTVKVATLLGILILPFAVALLASSDTKVLHWENLTPVWPGNWSQFNVTGIGTAMLGVLWAYHGWMNIAPVAEEVRNPSRNIPLALLAGVGTIIFLYLGANLAYYLVLSGPQMAGLKDTPVVTSFSLQLLPAAGGVLASLAVMCSVFGALSGNLLVGPRLLYAMGEDGLAPRALGQVHRRFHTPALAIGVMATWACMLVVGALALKKYGLRPIHLGELTFDLNVPPDKSLFDILTDFAMFGAIIFETLAITTIYVFRRRFPTLERPYRCWGYPIVPAIYVCIMALVLASMCYTQRMEAVAGFSFIAVGAIVYYIAFGRRGEQGA